MAYTLDLLIGGTASADTEFNGSWLAVNACDNNFTDGTGWLSAQSDWPHWWKYDFGAGILHTIAKLTYTGSVDNGISIKDFKLQGSNNNSDWTDIYTGLTVKDTHNTQIFTFNNNIPYRYYRIYMTSSWRSTDTTLIAGAVEFEMMGIRGGGFSGGQPWIF